MDIDSAIKRKKQRADELDAIVNPRSPEENEDPRTLAERYQSIIDRAAKIVDHDNLEELVGMSITQLRSKTINVARTEGPLPNIGLRFTYAVLNNPVIRDQRGYSFINESGEIVTGITAEWLHTPAVIVGNPLHKANSSAERLQFGEVFATETVSDPLERFNMRTSINGFRVIEESLDVYEAARNRAAELTYFKE